MAFLTDTLHTPFASKFAATLSTLIADAQNYRMYRKTVAELSSLSNNELFDLGLNRSTIKTSAIEAVYGY